MVLDEGRAYRERTHASEVAVAATLRRARPPHRPASTTTPARPPPEETRMRRS